jgi:hypothetical protein
VRTIEKLSPTSLHVWESDPEDFYVRYLADERKPRDPQTGAMAVGSAFDAFVKCNLHQHLFGNDGDGEYDLDTLFDKQVEDEEIRPWAWLAGEYAFNCYRTWGCYDELLAELEQSEEDPRFEFELRGEVGGVPLVGKPDLWYKRNVQVVYDWKVTGFCSAHPQSPKKFYKLCRDCWGEDRAKPTRGGGQPKAHKGYEEIDHHGHKIGKHFLGEVNKTWADQLCIYSWMLGVEVGDDDVVVGLDQLACKPSPDVEVERFPLIRVAQHRCRISEEWQTTLLGRLQHCWAQIQSGHIFEDLTRADSDARCEVLDMQVHDTEEDPFWASLAERKYRG